MNRHPRLFSVRVNSYSGWWCHSKGIVGICRLYMRMEQPFGKVMCSNCSFNHPPPGSDVYRSQAVRIVSEIGLSLSAPLQSPPYNLHIGDEKGRGPSRNPGSV